MRQHEVLVLASAAFVYTAGALSQLPCTRPHPQPSSMAFGPEQVRFADEVGRRSAAQSRRRETTRLFAGDDAEEMLRRAAALREDAARLQAENEAALEAAVEAETIAKPEPPPPPPVVQLEEKKQVDVEPQNKRELVRDTVPWATRALACACYALPLSDALPYGKYLANDFPEVIALLVLPYAPFLALLRAVPFGFGGLATFLLLSTTSRNPEFPRFLRFSMQQACLIDVGLIFPDLLANLFGKMFTLPPAVAEPLTTTVFFAVSLSIVYCVQANARSQTPNALPFVSEATDRIIGPF
mmetsp:Transcript_22318/g.68696  ORF Transcript_22318/g.68696 Transcript_22318/m.68696 type:complete len:298 (-) Transcript_22318:302-1195(-)